MKNILATITALTSRMMRSSHSIEDFAAAFQERLQGMARTHELLSRQNLGGADIGDLLRATLASYSAKDGRNVTLQGDPFRLNANAAATLGMVFFELASNAAKYGAFAAGNGRVEISWRVHKPGGLLSIVWKEREGPAVRSSPTRNFGTTFIEQSLNYELNGSAALKFRKAGLECVMEIPLSSVEVSGGASA